MVLLSPFRMPRNRLIGPLLAFLFLISLFLLQNLHSQTLPNGNYCQAAETPPSLLATIPLKRQRVAVASKFSYHFDVYISFAWSLARAMNRSSTGGMLEVYAETPFHYHFQTIINDLHLYPHGYRNPEDLLPAIKNHTGEGGIDTVVLGTCEAE